MIPNKIRDNTQTAADFSLHAENHGIHFRISYIFSPDIILSSKYLGNVINIFIAKLQS